MNSDSSFSSYEAEMNEKYEVLMESVIEKTANHPQAKELQNVIKAVANRVKKVVYAVARQNNADWCQSVKVIEAAYEQKIAKLNEEIRNLREEKSIEKMVEMQGNPRKRRRLLSPMKQNIYSPSDDSAVSTGESLGDESTRSDSLSASGSISCAFLDSVQRRADSLDESYNPELED